MTSPQRSLVLAIGAVVSAALVSVLLGFYQTTSEIYLYDITNFGSHVGLFANANHTASFYAVALLCAGIVAVEVNDGREMDPRFVVAALAGVAFLLVVAAFVTGSRAGQFFAVVALLVGAFLLIRPASETERRLTAIAVVPLVVLIGGGLFVATLNNVAGLAEISTREVDRAIIFSRSLDIAADLFPFGGGADVFQPLYRGTEDPSRVTNVFVNRAHSDVLEWIIEIGIFAPVALAVACVSLTMATLRQIRRRPHSAIAPLFALIGLGILLLHSVVDYPLRTLSMATIAALLAGYLLRGEEARVAS